MYCLVCNQEFDLKPGTLYERKRMGRSLNLCSNCIASGENSGTWKGGHRHWSPGRYGKDKDGLSWKTQRRLAWERDNFECQHCHTKKNRKPDVHHVVPFRVSQSHALDNLVCLCQGCHLTEEAKVQEKWGGQLLESVKLAPRHPCSVCGEHRQYRMGAGICRQCLRQTRVNDFIAEAKKLREAGATLQEIQLQLDISMGSAHRYSTWK